MATIEIDFQVFKALTALRADESVTYNDVLRQVLGLEEQEPEVPHSLAAMYGSGCTYKGILFSNGSQFRANYKGKTYLAEIKNGGWVMSDGTQCTSPSHAARHITQTNVNGWRFWQVKRPEDADWKLMDLLLR